MEESRGFGQLGGLAPEQLEQVVQWLERYSREHGNKAESAVNVSARMYYSGKADALNAVRDLLLSQIE